MTREEAESLLFREARFLDERRFDEWLSMFTADCLYWVPTVDGDPDREASLIYDDHPRMQERVYRLLETKAYAQLPPSRTQHNISNVEVLDGPDERSVRVLSNLMLVEVRAGGDGQVGTGRLRLLAARCAYLFVDGPDWRIRQKKLSLIDRDLPHHNLSFIL